MSDGHDISFLHACIGQPDRGHQTPCPAMADGHASSVLCTPAAPAFRWSSRPPRWRTWAPPMRQSTPWPRRSRCVWEGGGGVCVCMGWGGSSGRRHQGAALLLARQAGSHSTAAHLPLHAPDLPSWPPSSRLSSCARRRTCGHGRRRNACCPSFLVLRWQPLCCPRPACTPEWEASAQPPASLASPRNRGHSPTARCSTNTIGAVARIRNALAYATHRFFQVRLPARRPGTRPPRLTLCTPRRSVARKPAHRR